MIRCFGQSSSFAVASLLFVYTLKCFLLCMRSNELLHCWSTTKWPALPVCHHESAHWALVCGAVFQTWNKPTLNKSNLRWLCLLRLFSQDARSEPFQALPLCRSDVGRGVNIVIWRHTLSCIYFTLVFSYKCFLVLFQSWNEGDSWCHLLDCISSTRCCSVILADLK